MLKRWRGDRWFHARETHRMDQLNGLPLASFRQRAFALAIDLGLLALLKSVVFSSLFLLFFRHRWREAVHIADGHELLKKAGEELERLIGSALILAAALKLGRGQTPGKRWMKIRVVSLEADEVTWWMCIERALGYGASLLEGDFGFFQYFLNRNRMCVHDRIAETIVVDLRRPRQAPEIATAPEQMLAEAAGEA